MALYTADWTPLGKNIYYRKIELYSMQWVDQVNLSDCIIVAAPFGGPIAVQQDARKLQKTQFANKSNIYIFSASGQAISTVKWNSGPIAPCGLGWSSSEDLVCVLEDGNVILYDMYGNIQKTTSMGQDVKDTGVLECRIFNNSKFYTGVAVLTGAFNIFLVNNIKEPRIRKMATVPGLSAPPSSWAVIAEERNTKVLVAKDANLYLLNQNEDKCTQVFPKFNTQINAIIEMTVSCNNQNIALFSDNGALWMGSANLETKYCEFDTQAKTRPHQLVWCGNGAVVGFWQVNKENIMIVIGPERDYMNDIFYSPIHLVPEIDGVRIIGNSTHELLQKVPDAVIDVFKIGSLSPSALLLEASNEFRRHSHKADEYIRMIREKSELEEAVECCLKAAGHEFQPPTQKMLLRAASFGKNFIPDMDPEPFVKMCQTLRVLNAVRVNVIGLPITYTQLEFLSIPVLLDRLVLRRHYCYAICICQYLKIPDTEGASRILDHWACYKVKRTKLDPESTARAIAEKLGTTPGISYAEISHKAMEYGHSSLAVKLLDYETRASEQVPLLIKLKQETQAMIKAIDSGDTDLIYTVIRYLKNSLSKGDFHMRIRQFPAAHDFYLKLCKEQDLELLRENYSQESDFLSEGHCFVMESYQTKKADKRISSLQEALKSYKKAKNDFAAQITEEQLKLIKYQISFEEKFPQNYHNLSLHETIKQLLTHRESRLADDLRREFKVPDRRFWWLQITVLADGGDWLELEKFSRSKKSPIGYEPFVDVCVKHDNIYEAQKYLPKVKEENRIKYYIKARLLEDAAKIAFEKKDLAALNQVQNMCGVMDRTIADKITTMKSQLSSKR
ncbi:vacuolar protein sorting-associated protein 16 homolog [Uloborus diversus]|uniref:vacuolar protein sorting-associated protein 16 homolog n=1 Tax=Uloborus diversus TaxID=327109 RepID=UPI002409DD08|nr:vacuolar protein sorting-associated protein 16 homolog [Uloborus diversus]